MKSVEWYTPAWIFDALGLKFDMDPASPHDMATPVPAAEKLTVFDDGLRSQWRGLVWLNPPYGRKTELWIRRMIDHGRGLCLVFARTDAKWSQEAMRAASAALFFAGRIQFIPGNENAHKRSRCGAASVLFAFGDEAAIALKRLSDRGVYVELRAAA